jgi:LPXTG-motif cell wall-anchored protein
MLDWITENFWAFMGVMILVLAALIGLLLFLRKKQSEE